MVHSSLLQSLAGCLGGLPPARDYDLRVDLLGDEELSFLKDKAPGLYSFGYTVENPFCNGNVAHYWIVDNLRKYHQDNPLQLVLITVLLPGVNLFTTDCNVKYSIS
jgi:hypothetical protein